MSRFFSGFRAGGSGNKKSAKQMFMEKMQKEKYGIEDVSTPEEQYKKMFDDRMSNMKKDAYKPGFSLPGTSGGGRQMSKSAEALLEQLAEKKAKQDMKKMKKKAEAKRMEEKRTKKALEMKNKQEAAVAAKKQAEATKAFFNNMSSGSGGSGGGGGFWGGGSDKKDDGWW